MGLPCVALYIVHQEADGLRGVPWGLEDLEAHAAELEVQLEGAETKLKSPREQSRGAVVLAEVLLGDGPVEQRDRKLCKLERLIEAGARFRVTSEFLILNAQIEIAFGVSGIFLDLLQPQREIKPLLGRDALFAPDLSVMVDDRGKLGELQIFLQPVRIDNFVNGSLKSQLGG